MDGKTLRTIAWTLTALLLALGAVGSGSAQTGEPEFKIPVDPGVGQKNDLTFETLVEHIGETEEVALGVYFVGFPAELRRELRTAVLAELAETRIVDAREWWVPNMPRYGEADFATVPAPPWLPERNTPPDGLVRYDPVSMVFDNQTGLFLPVRELVDLVEDWQHNNDVIYNVVHEGALPGVEWIADDVRVKFLPASAIDTLYEKLEGSKRTLTSSNPARSLSVYSYNELFDWLEGSRDIRQPVGGAAIVFLNLDRFGAESYTFYADPRRDLIPTPGNGPIERQYAPARSTPEDPRDQRIDLAMSTLLGGGLTQAKMFAAVEVRCTATTTAADKGVNDLPGFEAMRDDQSLCAEWTLDPIPNLLGNKGRRYFVSDATRELADYGAGVLSSEDLIEKLRESLFQLYRFGVLQPSIKANHVYSERYELRTLLVDVRYSQTDLCVFAALASDGNPYACATPPPSTPSEQTYTLSDVFDEGLALDALGEFAPGDWIATYVPFVWGLQPDQTVDIVQAALFKAGFRDAVDDPTLELTPGVTVDFVNTPLYRTMETLDDDGNLVEFTSSWEHGLDVLVTLAAFVEDEAHGGLGIYSHVWGDAEPLDERPYHETGERAVKPLVLFLTPAPGALYPGGPARENWGTFPLSWQAVAGLFGSVNVFGGGGFWVSVGGNEEAGGLLRRDYLGVVPQYMLGPNRGNGQQHGFAVLPNGLVTPFDFPGITAARLEAGAPHWCNEFEEPGAAGDACRDFVRVTTTLQSIETLQHGMGYLHAPEPRTRFHYDGERSSITRVYELVANPDDAFGHLLHQMVNMYTTLGESTVWGQIVSEWNGVGPQAGMQATLFRSHAREEILAGERHLSHAIERYENGFAPDATIVDLLRDAIEAHDTALDLYDRWDYRGALDSALSVLSLTDRALTAMWEPDRIHDPLAPVPAAASRDAIRVPVGGTTDLLERLKRTVAEYRKAVEGLDLH